MKRVFSFVLVLLVMAAIFSPKRVQAQTPVPTAALAVSEVAANRCCHPSSGLLAVLDRQFPEMGKAVEKKADTVVPGSGKHVRWMWRRAIDGGIIVR